MLFRGVYYFTLATLHLLLLSFIPVFAGFKKYRRSIPARFLLFKNPRLSSGGVWFHSCSFGEARAVAPIVKMFDKSQIRLTTTTQTGFSEISKLSKESRFLPFETLLPFWVTPQKVLVVLEAELWYMLFFVAKSKGAYTMLLNARVSTKSFPKYLRFRWLYRRIFQNVDRVFAQSEDDRKRLEALGAKNVEAIGNIKHLLIPKPTKSYRKPEGLIVVAGSTHKGEEELILDSFLELKQSQKDAKLILVPRHPERFDEVEEIIKSRGVDFERFSNSKDFKSDIVLVDAMGELVNLYQIADIVVLGGAFVPAGGHNFLEPAQFGLKIITGEHTFNQKDILDSISGITKIESEELSKTLKNHHLLPSSQIKQRDVNIKIFKEEVERVLQLQR